MTRLTAIRSAHRRTQSALRHFVWRRWLPDLGDLSIVAGALIIGHVFYQIAPIIGEAYTGLIFCLIGIARMLVVGRRS